MTYIKRTITVAVLLSVLFILTAINSSAATTSHPWVDLYGGSKDDGFNQIINTSDGGYALAGFTASYGNGTMSVWLVKIDPQGNVQWHKTYGGAGQSDGNSIVQTKDGGYAIAGYSTSLIDGDHNIYLVKTDANGNLLWNRTYNTSEPGFILDISALPDGSLIMAGVVYTDNAIAKACAIKIDANGNELWDKMYGGARKDEAHFVAPTNDGGFIITGYTQSYGDQKGDVFVNGTGDAWLLKIDAQGKEQWNKTYGGDAVDDSYYVLQSADGGYLLGGTTRSYSNDWDRAYIVKTDSLGNEQWNRTYGNNSSDAIYAIGKTIDGYVLTGTMYPNTGNLKTFLIKIDDMGNKTAGYSFGVNGDYNGYSICNDTEGGYMIAGTMNLTADSNGVNTDGFILKVNGDGTPVMVAGNSSAGDGNLNNSLSPTTIFLILVTIACVGTAIIIIWKWILKR